MGCGLSSFRRSRGGAAYKPLPVDEPKPPKATARDCNVVDKGTTVLKEPLAPPPPASKSTTSPGPSPRIIVEQLAAQLVGGTNYEAMFGSGKGGSAGRNDQASSSTTPGPSSASAQDAAAGAWSHLKEDIGAPLGHASGFLDVLGRDKGNGGQPVNSGCSGPIAAGMAAPAAGRQGDAKQRAMAFITALKDMPDDGPVKQGIGMCLRTCIRPLILVVMLYISVAKGLYAIYKQLPMNIIQMIFGLSLCFFGGVYYTAIAAIEAANNMGGEDLVIHLRTCWEEGSRITTASLEDDKRDKDSNGIADVREMSTGELINHKAKVAMVAVKEPERFQKAIIALMSVYLSVIATLKYEFAKTVAVALGIANMLTLPATRALGPVLTSLMGPDLRHWVPTIIDTTIKIIAVVVASYIQAFISAFYSGLRGGRMFAEGALNLATTRGWMERLPESLAPKPFDPDKSYLDEALAYPIAALGFYTQVRNGFTVMFPFNVALFPLTLVEFLLRYQVYT
eukprot:CAMPEP_0115261442 /NCGR_PEP_ID=MMETSP0270-20121206/48860_1 /TAXON_ID=71861 /ORGANISM="Scrippsiella trochoidea, Strain CCMP3099" /LENGTH=507 /DNA_ID=CAMNT_0002677319 /DNA_START=14 /DNA_END=1537 /DNA_ORIENTATION=+